MAMQELCIPTLPVRSYEVVCFTATSVYLAKAKTMNGS